MYKKVNKFIMISYTIPSSRLVSSYFTKEIIFYTENSEVDPMIFSGRNVSKLMV